MSFIKASDDKETKNKREILRLQLEIIDLKEKMENDKFVLESEMQSEMHEMQKKMQKKERVLKSEIREKERDLLNLKQLSWEQEMAWDNEKKCFEAVIKMKDQEIENLVNEKKVNLNANFQVFSPFKLENFIGANEGSGGSITSTATSPFFNLETFLFCILLLV